MAHHGGAPFRIATGRNVGPYVVSVWAAPDVAMGMVYVVYTPRDGAPVVGPATVRIGVAPVSGRLTETLYDARSEPVAHGARFVAMIPFDRAEEWRVRVVTDGPAGGGEISAPVRVVAPGTPGPLGILFYAAPFMLVAGLWWRTAASRSHRTDVPLSPIFRPTRGT